MQLVVLSYNLKFHKAYPELAQLVKSHKPDILCLQECYSDRLDQTIGNLKLAGKTMPGKHGLAIYCRNNRFKVSKIHKRTLSLSLLDRLQRVKRTRLLIAELYDRSCGQDVNIGCIHASELTSTNLRRRRQLKTAMRSLCAPNCDTPAVLIGDYNYPYFIGRLRRMIECAGYIFAETQGPTYKRFFYRGKFDFSSATNVSDLKIEALPFQGSDHAPVIARTEIA